MNEQAAYDALPADAKWSSSFGYPGNEKYSEFWRTPNGRRFLINKDEYGLGWTIASVLEQTRR